MAVFKYSNGSFYNDAKYFEAQDYKENISPYVAIMFGFSSLVVALTNWHGLKVFSAICAIANASVLAYGVYAEESIYYSCQR